MLEVANVEKAYGRKSWFHSKSNLIVKGVSFECAVGECVGIIGESGSGKSTLSRMLLGIERPDKGQVTLNKQPIYRKQVRRHQISAVFQDYTSSLHPFHTVRDIMFEVMCRCNYKREGKEKLEVEAIEFLEEVGLSAEFLDKYPHMLSGGEAQRVAIARAISMHPQYILFDEAISSLDMSIQTQILDLLKYLRCTRHLSYIFITHDIQAVTYVCDRLIIFKEGQIEECIATRDLHLSRHPYTTALIHKQLTL